MLKARVITALVLLAGLLSALFLLPAIGWLVFSSLICALAATEWASMLGFSPAMRRLYALLLGGLCLAMGLVAGLHKDAMVAPFALEPVYAVSAIFWLLCVPFWLRAKWRLSESAAAPLIGSVLLLPPSLAIAHLRLLSPWLLLGVMGAVWLADIAAYFVGRAFGRRKLAPSISPGKSWEGACGAMLAVTLYGLSCISYWGSFKGLALLPVALLLLGFTGLSIIGDLFESLVKRQAGVKDSGTLLPGHGGVLDRIDSLTSTLPVVALIALWMAR
ncbi:MAG: phosphatidate cytidylyltransferase [Proteobacteria bacterium]|nr:phosphatidate cytidylyltransferase [Pseudomonadota bacterium]